MSQTQLDQEKITIVICCFPCETNWSSCISLRDQLYFMAFYDAPSLIFLAEASFCSHGQSWASPVLISLIRFKLVIAALLGHQSDLTGIPWFSWILPTLFPDDSFRFSLLDLQFNISTFDQ